MSFQQLNKDKMDQVQTKINERLKAEGLFPSQTATSAPLLSDEVIGLDREIETGADEVIVPKGKRKLVVEDDETGETYEEEFAEEDVDKRLQELYLKAKRAEYRENEAKAVKDEYSSRKTALDSREKETQRLLAAAQNNEEVKEILELAKNKGSIEEFKRKIIDEHSKYMSMSDEEKRSYDQQRDRADSLKREKNLQDQLEGQMRTMNEREAQLKRQEMLVMYKSAYKTASFTNENNDPGIDRLNRTIFNNAQEILTKMASEGVVLTEAIIKREFKKEHALLAKTVKPKESTKVKDMISELDNTAGAIQAKGTNKKAAGETRGDVISRWQKLIVEGKALEVLKEAQSNPALMNLYVQEGKNLITKRVNKPATGNSHLKR